MLDSGLSSGEIDAYSNVARLSRERLAKRIAELSPKPAGGWTPERLELEKRRLDLRGEEERGRNARAGSKNDAANARLAASVAKNMGDIKHGGDENPTEQPKGEQQGQARQISSPSEMADAPVGSWFVKGKKKYVKRDDGQFLPEE